jgi:aspartate kinase
VRKAGYDTVVVVSAMGDTTDRLKKLAFQITDSPSEREMDVLTSTGEQVSVALLAMAIHSLGYEAISFTGAQVGIVTDSAHTRAKIVRIEPVKIKNELSLGRIAIVAGFQGITHDAQITTLGRGASDLTAIALGAVFKAEVVEIYTDVDGVYTADPRIVRDARKLPVITYDEMLEMASLGAQVMHGCSRSCQVKFFPGDRDADQGGGKVNGESSRSGGNCKQESGKNYFARCPGPSWYCGSHFQAHSG